MARGGQIGSQYLRSAYWSLITLTTAGHADVVKRNDTDVGRDWEVVAALFVALLATFAFTCTSAGTPTAVLPHLIDRGLHPCATDINANFTTMMIRLNARLEESRKQLSGVEVTATHRNTLRIASHTVSICRDSDLTVRFVSRTCAAAPPYRRT